MSVDTFYIGGFRLHLTFSLLVFATRDWSTGVLCFFFRVYVDSLQDHLTKSCDMSGYYGESTTYAG